MTGGRLESPKEPNRPRCVLNRLLHASADARRLDADHHLSAEARHGRGRGGVDDAFRRGRGLVRVAPREGHVWGTSSSDPGRIGLLTPQ